MGKTKKLKLVLEKKPVSTVKKKLEHKKKI